ncbi:uncharacterized protein FIBRA_00420 [Fibroporia radiculosa]|uniref:Uncharacterized protein n=1 Tax=Fibroporia radiculosa TaxID=599839 RepID=J4G074_9APHY|nr:uncharacterized protein FIBRA_00420 [Fibroporia radiculosa]CCL98423.1 predicted protein [Fibroporia radiculosa]
MSTPTTSLSQTPSPNVQAGFRKAGMPAHPPIPGTSSSAHRPSKRNRDEDEEAVVSSFRTGSKRTKTSTGLPRWPSSTTNSSAKQVITDPDEWLEALQLPNTPFTCKLEGANNHELCSGIIPGTIMGVRDHVRGCASGSSVKRDGKANSKSSTKGKARKVTKKKEEIVCHWMLDDRTRCSCTVSTVHEYGRHIFTKHGPGAEYMLRCKACGWTKNGRKDEGARHVRTFFIFHVLVLTTHRLRPAMVKESILGSLPAFGIIERVGLNAGYKHVPSPITCGMGFFLAIVPFFLTVARSNDPKQSNRDLD